MALTPTEQREWELSTSRRIRERNRRWQRRISDMSEALRLEEEVLREQEMNTYFNDEQEKKRNESEPG